MYRISSPSIVCFLQFGCLGQILLCISCDLPPRKRLFSYPRNAFTFFSPLATTSCSLSAIVKVKVATSLYFIYTLFLSAQTPKAFPKQESPKLDDLLKYFSSIHFIFSTPESVYHKGLWLHLFLQWSLQYVQFLRWRKFHIPALCCHSKWLHG